MKEKIMNVLTNVWFQGAVSLILTFLIVWQEIFLGTDKSVWLGLIFSAVFGLFYEFIRWMAVRDKYNFKNLIPWICGGIVACLLAMLI